MDLMKAIRFHEYGGPEVLRYEEVPRPEPGEGDVLVRVHAASINPVDWKIRAGYMQAVRPFPLPYILGWDFSGVVESVGAGVTEWKPGDEVYARPDTGRSGAYAEYTAVRAAEIARKPRSLDHVHAAAVPLTALTAWQALFDHGGVAAGHKVLIHAAAGGVGSFAVQFAKIKGAHVAGTASARHHDYLRGLGCDQPVDYTTTRFEEAVRDIDMVLDSMGGEIRARSWKVLKPGGILVSIVGPPPSEEEAKAHGVGSALFLVSPNAAQLTEIASLIDAGQVKVHVEAVFPLAEAARAHELSQTNRVQGKIVLQVK
jgi:NADPH:quinone reductase-like Zn-dependent oxidoreductase